MIKKGMLAACALMLTMAANAQNAYDAERVLGNDLNGTARFVGMGGAMSALGGDLPARRLCSIPCFFSYFNWSAIFNILQISSLLKSCNFNKCFIYRLPPLILQLPSLNPLFLY